MRDLLRRTRSGAIFELTRRRHYQRWGGGRQSRSHRPHNDAGYSRRALGKPGDQDAETNRRRRSSAFLGPAGMLIRARAALRGCVSYSAFCLEWVGKQDVSLLPD